jgi:hypothetical protein
MALPAAGIAAGAYTGFQQAKGVYDAFKGEDLDWQQQAALALPTFGASFLYNPVKDLFDSGKGKDQLARDEYRSQLQESKFIDDKYNWTTADGKAYDMGLDGSKANYNVDFAKEGMGDVVGGVNPLSALMLADGTDKQRSDLTGQLANAAVSSGDTTANIMKQYADAGFADRQSAYDAVLNLPDIDDATRNAYLASIDKTFGVKNPNAGR